MAKTEVRGAQIADGANGVNLTVDVNGILPVANGGTGSSTDTKVTADGITVVKLMTQAAYDALGSWSSTTLYVIVG